MNLIKGILSLGALLVFVGCGKQQEMPTTADVEKAIRATWEKPGDNFSPKSTVQINSVKFGKSDVATAQEVVDGIPRDSVVTAARIDFTQRQYYTDKTRVVRRVRDAHVYKDKFGEWAVMTGQAIKDESSEEPPAK